MTLAKFLLARIAEDEAAARDCCGAEVGHLQAGDPYEDGSGVADRPDYPSYPWGIGERELAFAERFDPARVLAECETKRRIVEHLSEASKGFDWMTATDAERDADKERGVIARLLALPYADHPDFRPEWRPDPVNAE